MQYQKLSPSQYPAWYEQKLWGVYDVPDYVRNLFNTTMVAYGGEIDPQRASAEIMAEAFKAEGHELTFITGPKMPHRYDPASLAQIMQLMHEAEEKGVDRFEPNVSLQTRTLRYNQMRWATIDALHKHWDDSRLDASITGDHSVAVKTKNVDAFTLSTPWRSLSPAKRSMSKLMAKSFPFRRRLWSASPASGKAANNGHLVQVRQHRFANNTDCKAPSTMRSWMRFWSLRPAAHVPTREFRNGSTSS